MSSKICQRVAVVGAGAAGLCALKHLAANTNRFLPVAFEMTSEVSGTWSYTDRVGTDEKGQPLHSSMYKNLRTNLPKEVMAFPEFPFPRHLPSFVKHSEVKEYLEDYAKHYDLLQYIQFNKKIVNISPKIRGSSDTSWQVDITSSGTPGFSQTIESQEFDAVMVCNGHYAIPLIPEVSGLSAFQGLVMHSHDYRLPESFEGKTVALLGAASSGQDIALDVATCAKHVYLCHKKPPLSTVLPSNVSQATGIKKVHPNSITLEDDQELLVDVLMFCTGYLYDFHFLSPDCRPKIDDQRVTPLYKHIIHTRYPSLSLIGVCKKICPFPQFDCQVRFVLAALTGDMVLPSVKEMDADTEKDFKWRLSEGMPVRYAHLMGTLQWGYNDELAKIAGFEPIPRVVQTLYDYVHVIRVQNLPAYKNVNYELLNSEQFKELKSSRWNDCLGNIV